MSSNGKHETKHDGKPPRELQPRVDFIAPITDAYGKPTSRFYGDQARWEWGAQSIVREFGGPSIIASPGQRETPRQAIAIHVPGIFITQIDGTSRKGRQFFVPASNIAGMSGAVEAVEVEPAGVGKPPQFAVVPVEDVHAFREQLAAKARAH